MHEMIANRAHMRRLRRIVEREDLRALRALIIQRTGTAPSNDDVVEMAMHKMRVEMTKVRPDLREESLKWLRERGLRRLTERDDDDA